MAQSSAQKRKVNDKTGTQFFPITHVEAVIDDNGTTVASTLSSMDTRITALEGTDFDGVVYSNTEYPEL